VEVVSRHDLRVVVLYLFVILGPLLACDKEESSMLAHENAISVTSDTALRVARMDAERVYRNLSEYRAVVSLEKDGWHVDYALKDILLQGGGAHYVIDAKSGAILEKRYEQ
jgi:hypothetical protein